MSTVIKFKCACGRWHRGVIVFDHVRGVTYVQGCPCGRWKAA